MNDLEVADFKIDLWRKSKAALLSALRRRKKFHTAQVLEHKLHIASGYDHNRLDVVEALIDEHGVNVNRCLMFANDYGGGGGLSAKTPLFRACCCEDKTDKSLSIIRKLLDSGAEVDFMCPEGTALEVATNSFPAPRGDIIMELLSRGARCDLPYIDMFRARPLDKICGLSISIGLSKPADVRFLIDLAKAAIRNGGDVNAQDERGCRVLNGAACRGNRPALMEFLISQGTVVNPPAREHSGITPLVNAARGESRKDSSGDHSQRQESVRLLLNHGALIDAVTSYGYTALHSAYAANNFDVAALLECAGADTTLRTPKGELPRDLIKKEPHDAYLKQRWERRKHFVYFLRDHGLARGASGSGSQGLLGRRASLLQVLALDALQSAIVSYL